MNVSLKSITRFLNLALINRKKKDFIPLDHAMKESDLLAWNTYICVAKCDFQQCGILTSVHVDSDEPVQPPFKLKGDSNLDIYYVLYERS